ncbi:uncharacterized protein PHACADRAFT_266554 [Phanerochaete carnosa HHB-10118-sp]|uniref:Cyclase family protein n=1 Tax=Phanerochaete carnosa (strain HHB-10118-sp) TaxID=650164 RepID=K5VN12_PHACS|nr:uncharacterized protein PHACADRAFT_266554 [Phanerochaete carnosa HHB-10118-sp]EKM48090.1 hypothetical protein PHACADRAFT_266554 [Phanerochaete carnosa HHB-10118-sp]
MQMDAPHGPEPNPAHAYTQQRTHTSDSARTHTPRRTTPCCTMMPQPKNIIDLSQPLATDKVYACEGHPRFNVCCILHVSNGTFATVHSLALATHTGTHVDVPYHFFADGARVGALDLALLTAMPAVVVGLRAKGPREKITRDDPRPYAVRMQHDIWMGCSPLTRRG